MNEHDAVLRDQLVQRLRGRGAHMPFEEAVKDFPTDRIAEPFPNGDYSAWSLVEHIRRAQEDILDYITDPYYEHRQWPGDYWPESVGAEDWARSVNGFISDRDKLIAIVEDPETDLYAPIPWAPEHNILREVLIICDHSAYHVGEFAIMRQVMGTW